MREALGILSEESGVPTPANAWIGVSVEDQATAEERIPFLLTTEAAVRWISAEPLLGPIDLTRIDMLPRVKHDDVLCHLNALTGVIAGPDDQLPRLDWVVAGGESGPKARPSHPDWFRGLRDQCAEAGVPFLFKQWGEWIAVPEGARFDPTFAICYGDVAEGVFSRVGKKLAGRLLDGVTHDGYPA